MVFAGYSFAFVGFRGDQIERLRQYVEGLGGRVVDKATVPDQRRHFVVVPLKRPINQLPEEVFEESCKCIVTECYLECCEEASDHRCCRFGRPRVLTSVRQARSVLDPMSQRIFRPLLQAAPVPGFQDVVVCATHYSGIQREHIKRLVTVMGGHYSDALVRKSTAIAPRTTHLLAMHETGIKVNKAKAWGSIKIVSRDWLWDCSQKGRKVIEGTRLKEAAMSTPAVLPRTVSSSTAPLNASSYSSKSTVDPDTAIIRKTTSQQALNSPQYNSFISRLGSHMPAFPPRREQSFGIPRAKSSLGLMSKRRDQDNKPQPLDRESSADQLVCDDSLDDPSPFEVLSQQPIAESNKVVIGYKFGSSAPSKPVIKSKSDGVIERTARPVNTRSLPNEDSTTKRHTRSTAQVAPSSPVF